MSASNSGRDLPHGHRHRRRLSGPQHGGQHLAHPAGRPGGSSEWANALKHDACNRLVEYTDDDTSQV